jgi:hypothetical protein
VFFAIWVEIKKFNGLPDDWIDNFKLHFTPCLNQKKTGGFSDWGTS